MERLHQLLAEDGHSDSQMIMAGKLLEQAISEKSQLKSETAIDMLISLAIDGHKLSASLLEECLSHDIGINTINRKIILKLLSRKELDITCEVIANRIMTTICDNQNHRLNESEFCNRVQRLVLQNNPMPINDNNNDHLIVTEQIVALNIKQVFITGTPFIDLTDDLNLKGIFGLVFNILRLSFKLIDLTFITSLLILFCLSLFLNYYYFTPNFRLLYQSFFDLKTLCLSLQLLEVYSFIKIVDRIYEFNNYKHWLKVIKAFNKQCNLDPIIYFRRCVLWISILLVTLALELNIELIFDADFKRTPSISSSVIRQLMAFLSFLVLIKNNSNLLQIFLVIFHYLSQNFLQEIQTNFPYIQRYLTNYSLIFSLLIIIITTKPIMSSTSFNLILVPNLLTHILILSADYNSESLEFITSNIFKNIHSLFGTGIILVILKFCQKLSYISVIPRILIFADFLQHFNKTFSFMSFFVSILTNAYITRRIEMVPIVRRIGTFVIIFIASTLFLQIVFHNERQIKIIFEEQLFL